MNFTDTLKGAEKNVELKYCERCGGLFLRVPGAGIVYCGGCAARMAGPDSTEAMPSRLRRKSRGVGLASGAEQEELPGRGHIEGLQGVATEEVWSC